MADGDIARVGRQRHVAVCAAVAGGNADSAGQVAVGVDGDIAVGRGDAAQRQRAGAVHKDVAGAQDVGLEIAGRSREVSILGADAVLAGQVEVVGLQAAVQARQRALNGAQDDGAVGRACVDGANLHVALLRAQVDAAVAAAGRCRHVQRAGRAGGDVAVGRVKQCRQRTGIVQREVGRGRRAVQADVGGAYLCRKRGVASRGAAAEVQRIRLDRDRARRGAVGNDVVAARQGDGVVGLHAAAGDGQRAARSQQQVVRRAGQARVSVQVAGGAQIGGTVFARLRDVATERKLARAHVVKDDNRAVGARRQVAQRREVGAQGDAARTIGQVQRRADAAARRRAEDVAEDQVAWQRAPDGARCIENDVAQLLGVDRVDRQVPVRGRDRDIVSCRTGVADGVRDQRGAGSGDADGAVLGGDRIQRGAGRAVVVQIDGAGAGDFGRDAGRGGLQFVGGTRRAADARAGLQRDRTADDAGGRLAVVDDGAAGLAVINIDGACARVDVARHELAVCAVAGDLDRAVVRQGIGDLQVAGSGDVDDVARQIRVDGVIVRRQVHGAVGGDLDALAGRVDASVAGIDAHADGAIQRYAVGLDAGAGAVGQNHAVLGAERDLAVIGACLHVLGRDIARAGLDRNVIADRVGARGHAGQHQVAIAGDPGLAIGDRGRQAAQQVAGAVQIERAVAGDGGRYRAVRGGDLDRRVARADAVAGRQCDGAAARARKRAAAVQDAAGLGVQGQGVAGAVADRADLDVASGGGDRQVAAGPQVAQVDRTGLLEPDAARGRSGDVLDLRVQGLAGRADGIGRVARRGGQGQVARNDLRGRVHAQNRAARVVVRVGRQRHRAVLRDVDVVYVDRADGLVCEVQASGVAHDGQRGGVAGVGAAERQVLGVDGQEAAAAQVRALRVVADDGQVGKVGQVVDVDAARRGHRQLLGVQVQAGRVRTADGGGRTVVGGQADALARDQIAVVDAGDAAARG